MAEEGTFMFILFSLFACLTPGNPCANPNTPSWCAAAGDSAIPAGDTDTDSDSDADVDSDTDTDSPRDSGHDSGPVADSGPDSASRDTAVIDSGHTDSAADSADTSVGDTATETGLVDSGVIDSGPGDSGHDSSVTDTAFHDTADTAVTDTGFTDSASPDSGGDSAVDSGTDSAVIDTAISDTAVVVDPLDVDDDADGYTENAGDCDDADAAVNPAATELNTVKDENCDGEPFTSSSFTLSSGSTATITVGSDNVLDDASATFTDSAGAATTGSWVITADTSATSSLADLGPYAITWPSSGGLAGGTYESIAMLETNTSDGSARCIGLTASVTSGQSYVMILTTRNTASQTNEFCLYADSAEAGCVSQAMNTAETFTAAGSFAAVSTTTVLELCSTNLAGGVDVTQIGVYPASIVP